MQPMGSAARAVSTRDAILDACDRVLGRYGFGKMTLDDLAREAGVAKRTIYLHFRSKEDVGLSSIGRVVNSAQEKMRDLLASEMPAVERLREMLRARVMTRVLAVQDYHEGLDDLFELVRPAYMVRRRDAFELEAGLLAECLSDPAFVSENPTAVARTILLATNAFLPYSLSVRELGRPEAIESQLDAMVDLLIRGLTR